MKDLRTYAPADLISFMEHISGKPATLSSYKDTSKSTPFNRVKAVLLDGHLVTDVRSPKHKFTVEVSPGLMVANPELVAFLKVEGYLTFFAERVRLCNALGAFRCFTVSPRRAERLRELLGSLAAPVAMSAAAGGIPAELKVKLEALTGRELAVSVVDDWPVSVLAGPAVIASLGPSCPSIIFRDGELYAGTGCGLLDCPLSQWIIDGGFVVQQRGDSLVSVNRLWCRGGGWWSFRRIHPDQLEQVCQMIGELMVYQVTHDAPAGIQ